MRGQWGKVQACCILENKAKNKKQENGRKSQKYCGYNDRIVLKYVKKQFMEYSAIFHDMDKRFCYAIDKDIFVICVQVKKGWYKGDNTSLWG